MSKTMTVKMKEDVDETANREAKRSDEEDKIAIKKPE
jgi:hypothetical protein